jgi:hypothetical protein
MTGQQQANGNAEQTSIQVHSGDLVVDTYPLRTADSGNGQNRSVELKYQAPDCMVLEPRKTALLRLVSFVLLMTLPGITMLVFTTVEHFRQHTDWGGRAFGIVVTLFTFAGFFVLVRLLGSGQRWLRFDRESGLLTISRRPFWSFWRRPRVVDSRPLADLVGVQLIYCGVQEESYEVGEPGTPGSVTYRQYHSYQLNLVLHGESEPRLNLAGHSDDRWMREAGRQLADFLGVPLIDQARTSVRNEGPVPEGMRSFS